MHPVSVSVCLSLSLSHTHTHTHRLHAYTHTHTHTHTHTPHSTYTHTHTHTHTACMRTHTHTHTHTRCIHLFCGCPRHPQTTNEVQKTAINKQKSLALEKEREQQSRPKVRGTSVQRFSRRKRFYRLTSLPLSSALISSPDLRGWWVVCIQGLSLIHI